MRTDAKDSIKINDTDVEAAFDILLEIIEDTVVAVNQEGAAAIESGKNDLALEYVERGKAIMEFHGEVTALRDEWISNMNSVETLVGNPGESDRLVRKDSGRFPRGMRTPEASFRQPILEAIMELGGSASIDDVLGLVEQKMSKELNDVDYQSLPSDPSRVRWQNTAQWARYSMVQEGLLKSDSQRGIWELTEAGRRWLNEVRHT